MDIQSILDNLIFANLLFVRISYWASLIFPKFKISLSGDLQILQVI